MGYTIQVSGIDELGEALRKAGNAAQGVAAASLYEGAGVMADAVSEAVHGIATEKFRYARNGDQRLPSPEEKALVVAAAKGVAKFRKSGGSVDTSVGLSNAGYGQLGNVTKPVPQIANAINSGTSFMKKQPFFRKAVSKARGPATDKIVAGIEQRVEDLMK